MCCFLSRLCPPMHYVRIYYISTHARLYYRERVGSHSRADGDVVGVVDDTNDTNHTYCCTTVYKVFYNYDTGHTRSHLFFRPTIRKRKDRKSPETSGGSDARRRCSFGACLVRLRTSLSKSNNYIYLQKVSIIFCFVSPI